MHQGSKNSKTGWIKIHRKIADNPLFQKDPLAQWLFIKLIELAAWRDTTTTVNRSRVEVSRGSVVVSIRRLSALTGLSIKQVRTRLVALEKHNVINRGTQGGTLEGASRGTIPDHISICKYSEYQSVVNLDGTLGEHDGAHKGAHKLKKLRKEKHACAYAREGSRSPPGVEEDDIETYHRLGHKNFWIWKRARMAHEANQ